MEARSAATGGEVGPPTRRRASRTAATKYKARSAAPSILVLDCRSLPASSSVQVGLRAVALEPVFWVEVGLRSLAHSPFHQLDRALELEYHAKGLWGESLSYHHQ